MRIAFSIAGLIVLAGCSAPRELKPVPAALDPLRQTETAESSRRCEALKKLLAPLPVRGVIVNPRAFLPHYAPEEVIARIRKLGFNRIYCRAGGLAEFSEEDGKRFRAFLLAANQAQLPVEILLEQRIFIRRERGNALQNTFHSEYPTPIEVIGFLKERYQALPENGRFSGVDFLVEPHTVSTENRALLYQSLLCWSPDSFGPGLDNDLLMTSMLKECVTFREMLGDIPLTLGMHDFYHELAEQGKLTKGKITDFTAISPKVLILNSANRPSQLTAKVVRELAAAPKDSALVMLVIAEHSSVTSGQLRRRDWRDLMRSLNYALREYRKYPSFHGLVIGNLASLEFMRQEKE